MREDHRMVEVHQPPKMWLPPSAKEEGGSHFDDELETAESKEVQIQEMMAEMVNHINARPDHTVYVGSIEERSKMRDVFNHWHRIGRIAHHPNIRLEYGISEGQIRIEA